MEGCEDASVAQVVAKGIGAPAKANLDEVGGFSLFMKEDTGAYAH